MNSAFMPSPYMYPPYPFMAGGGMIPQPSSGGGSRWKIYLGLFALLSIGYALVVYLPRVLEQRKKENFAVNEDEEGEGEEEEEEEDVDDENEEDGEIVSDSEDEDLFPSDFQKKTKKKQQKKKKTTKQEEDKEESVLKDPATVQGNDAKDKDKEEDDAGGERQQEATSPDRPNIGPDGNVAPPSNLLPPRMPTQQGQGDSRDKEEGEAGGEGGGGEKEGEEDGSAEERVGRSNFVKRTRVKELFNSLLKRNPTEEEEKEYSGLEGESKMLERIVRDYGLLPQKKPRMMTRMFDEGGGAGGSGVMSNGSMCCYASVEDSKKDDAQCMQVDVQGRVCLDKNDVLRRTRSLVRDIEEFEKIIESV